jgi:hypothetical protein
VRVDEAFRPAIDVRLDDGVLPTGHTDLAALTNVGPTRARPVAPIE